MVSGEWWCVCVVCVVVCVCECVSVLEVSGPVRRLYCRPPRCACTPSLLRQHMGKLKKPAAVTSKQSSTAFTYLAALVVLAVAVVGAYVLMQPSSPPPPKALNAREALALGMALAAEVAESFGSLFDPQHDAKMEEALKHFEVAQSAGDAAAVFFAAQAKQSLGDLDGAFAGYAAARRAHPKHHPTRFSASVNAALLAVSVAPSVGHCMRTLSELAAAVRAKAVADWTGNGEARRTWREPIRHVASLNSRIALARAHEHAAEQLHHIATRRLQLLDNGLWSVRTPAAAEAALARRGGCLPRHACGRH